LTGPAVWWLTVRLTAVGLITGGLSVGLPPGGLSIRLAGATLRRLAVRRLSAGLSVGRLRRAAVGRLSVARLLVLLLLGDQVDADRQRDDEQQAADAADDEAASAGAAAPIALLGQQVGGLRVAV